MVLEIGTCESNDEKNDPGLSDRNAAACRCGNFCTQIYTGLFTDNKELLELTCKVMPVYFLGISIFGIQCACQTSFISLGQAKVSLFIALLRKIILLIPLAVILPKFMGVMGIYRAEPIADVISVLTTSAVFIITVKKVLRNM